MRGFDHGRETSKIPSIAVFSDTGAEEPHVDIETTEVEETAAIHTDTTQAEIVVLTEGESQEGEEDSTNDVVEDDTTYVDDPFPNLSTYMEFYD